MKKISIVGVLVEGANWVLHPIENYRELQEYRKDFETQVMSVQKEKEDLQVKLQIERNKYNSLEEKYVSTRVQLSEVEKTLREKTSEFPEKLHDYLDMQAKLEEWEKQGTLKDDEIRNMKTTVRSLEQKVIYRNNVVAGLRNAKAELKYQIGQLEEQLNDARNQVVELAKRVEFLEKQKEKKTPREKIDYTLMAKKTVKRSKNDENNS